MTIGLDQVMSKADCFICDVEVVHSLYHPLEMQWFLSKVSSFLSLDPVPQAAY